MGCVRPVLEVVAHRPLPLPGGPWIMEQAWHDLRFAHWPVQSETLRPLVPSELALDTFEGNCWVGVAPFHMSGIRLRAPSSDRSRAISEGWYSGALVDRTVLPLHNEIGPRLQAEIHHQQWPLQDEEAEIHT